MIPSITTAKQIATQIVQAFGDTSDASYDQAYACINRAIGLIARRGSWPFFRSQDQVLVTTGGVQYYKLNPRVRQPRFLHMVNPAFKLMYMNLRDLRLAFPNNTLTSASPMYWGLTTFKENSAAWEIQLWPVPDGEYTIYIDTDQNPCLISSPTDEITSTGLPLEMVETVIALATALMYEKSADLDFEKKMGQAISMLEEDYYRMGMNIDDDLNAREYNGTELTFWGGPIFNPKFS